MSVIGFVRATAAVALSVVMSFAGRALADEAAYAPQALVKQGLWKDIRYDEPSATPIVFSGWCRTEGAQANDCCILLDIEYDNGENVWAVTAQFAQGTHGWQRASSFFIPTHPVRRIAVHALFRNRSRNEKPIGKAEFADIVLERREGRGERRELYALSNRPYTNSVERKVSTFTGRRVDYEKTVEPDLSPVRSPIPSGRVDVWTADSMVKVSPLTFPDARSSHAVDLSLAKRERESAQILFSAAADAEWKAADLVLPQLKRADGVPFKGSVEWRRQGYLARSGGANPHPEALPAHERWFPDPLLEPGPMRVRAGSTQGTWLTVHAAPDAEAGVYTGEVIVREGGEARCRVPMTVTVEPFALPATFGLETAYALMDGHLRAQYPATFRERKREAIDMMLDHRLNPDDISRTEPPDIEDLVYARGRGMNRFNILNIVPPPKDPRARWVLTAKPKEIFTDEFYDSFIGRVKPYYEKLRERGLEKLAYVYGFDECRREYYEGMETFWHKLQRDVPGLPLMSTAKNYKDYCQGRTDIPHLLSGDWYCPTTSDYDLKVSVRLRQEGKKVWWYTCCGPTWPYANFASWENPIIEARILGWMTWRWRADGFLFWIVNKWAQGRYLTGDDTYFPDYPTYNRNGAPGDGVLMYPGAECVLPSIRLAQCRDAVEDYEYLQLAAGRAGQAAADAQVDGFVKSLIDYSRDPKRLRTARRHLARIIAPSPLRFSVFPNFVVDLAKARNISVSEAARIFRNEGVEGFDCASSFEEIDSFIAGGLKPANFFGGFNCFAGEEKCRQQQLALLEKVERYKVGRVMVLPPIFPGKDDEAEFRQFVASVRDFVRLAKERNVVVTTEDFGARRQTLNPCGHSRYLKRLLDEVPELEFTLDSGNLYFREGTDSIYALAQSVLPRISHLHLKDWNAGESAKTASYASLGKGVIPNEALVKLLCRAGYDGWCTFENLVGEDILADLRAQMANVRQWREQAFRE